MKDKRKFNSRWVKHCRTIEEKKEFEDYLFGSKHLLDVLRNLLEEDLRANEKEMRKRDNYSLPAWSEAQADHLGSQRTLEKVIKLLEI